MNMAAAKMQGAGSGSATGRPQQQSDVLQDIHAGDFGNRIAANQAHFEIQDLRRELGVEEQEGQRAAV